MTLESGTGSNLPLFYADKIEGKETANIKLWEHGIRHFEFNQAPKILYHKPKTIKRWLRVKTLSQKIVSLKQIKYRIIFFRALSLFFQRADKSLANQLTIYRTLPELIVYAIKLCTAKLSVIVILFISVI